MFDVHPNTRQNTIFENEKALHTMKSLKTEIQLIPVEMNPQVMEFLEKKNLIIRLVPGGHSIAVEKEETGVRTVYESSPTFGSHKLISVWVNRTTLAAFGTHPDNEEFLLIGTTSSKPLYLVIALHPKDILQEKIDNGTLTAPDFVCLRVKYNDPEVSFFTMLAGTPHGEAIADACAEPASFYVTEPSRMALDFTDFNHFSLHIDYSADPQAVMLSGINNRV